MCRRLVVQEQRSDADAEGLSELLEVLQGRIALSEFDFCNVSALDVRVPRKVFLCPSFAVSELPDTIAERDGGRILRTGLRHAKRVRAREKSDNTLIVTIVRSFCFSQPSQGHLPSPPFSIFLPP